MTPPPRPARLLACALLLLLAGCAAPPVEIAAPPPARDAETLRQQHRAAIERIAAWRLKGTMAVTTGRAGKGGSASLLWDHHGAREEIELYGPFGGGRVRIVAADGRAVLQDTKGNTVEADSVADALQQHLGWPLPFESLRLWARGLADDGATELAWDDDGRLQRLRHGDWRVEFLEYRAVGAVELPRKLTIAAVPGRIEVYARNGEYLGDQFSVKVILRRWWDLRFES